MRYTSILLKRTAIFMAFFIVLLSHETVFSQTGIIVEPGENTIIDAMNAHPGDTLILQKGKEYVVSQAIEVTVPTVIRGEAYTLDDADPPAVIRGHAAPGEELSFYIIQAAADLTLIDLGFIGYTATNKQIYGIVGIHESNIEIEASGCIAQGVHTWMETHQFLGNHFLLKNNIHFNNGANPWACAVAALSALGTGGTASLLRAITIPFLWVGKICLPRERVPTVASSLTTTPM